VRKQIPKIQRVRDIVNQARMEVEDMISYIQDVVKNSDDVGSKAFQDNKLSAESICSEYHPGPFKSSDEIDLLKNEIQKY